MSPITIIWSMMAAASLTLAVIYGFVWLRNRSEPANLYFALTALGTAVLAGIELAMMRAESPAAMAAAIRWGHLPVWLIVVSLVGFVRAHLRAGPRWLAWSVVGTRTLALLANFLVGKNLNFLEVGIRSDVRLLGESVAAPTGPLNPWMAVGQLSLWLLVSFACVAAIRVWRRGERRRALVVGGSIAFVTLLATVTAALTFGDLVRAPFMASPYFMVIVLVMSYELSRDLLDAARLAARLRESEQRMTLATAAANLGVWTCELPRGRISATDVWRRLFGFTATERLSVERLLERVHPNDRDGVHKALAAAIAGDGGFEAEYRIVTPEGPLRWAASCGRVEFDRSGDPVLLRDVVMDVTRRKQAEAEAQQHRQELTHLVRVSTLGGLSAAITHELTQPLAAILSNAQAARRFLEQGDGQHGELSAILDDIVADNQRAGELIQRLRRMLRKGESEPEAMNVNVTIRDILKLMKSDLSAREVLVLADLTDDLPSVYADRVQVQQVLINLMLNACDAMRQVPANARELKVSTRLCGEGGVRISVADAGCGLPPGSEDRIFEPYFTTRADGLGLGLALSRWIVAAHGGSLWAENRPEGGAEVSFTLAAFTCVPA
jgi:two-component system, LuxR family, sensor kinase FixL